MAVEQNSKAARTIGRFMKNLDKYDMSMAIQRAEGQWNGKQESALIESILKDYPVPNIYALENEDKTWSIIDGKQRLTTIKRFMKDEFALSRSMPEVEVDGEVFDIAGKRYSELDEKVQVKITDFTLPIVGITGANEDDKRAIFARLNNGASLTPAQKRTVVIHDELLSLLRDCFDMTVTGEAVVEPAKKRGRKPKNVVPAPQKIVQKELSFWKDVAGLGEAARKSAADRDVIFQTLMLMDIQDDISFKNSAITDYIRDLQTDSEKMRGLFKRLNHTLIDMTEGLIGRGYDDKKRKHFKKTVIPFAVAGLDNVYKSGGNADIYLEALSRFLDDYEESGYNELCREGTAKPESIKDRMEFFEKFPR